MLHDFYTVDENSDTGHAQYHWEVYIPQGQHDQPESYRMARRDARDPKAKHSNMDSPTIHKGGQRKLVEAALLHMFQTGQVMYVVNKMTRAFIRRHAPVDKQPSAKRQRLNVELYPIAVAFPKNEAILVDFILDQEKPVRYQVNIPHATFDDMSTWQVLIYRRLNPRATKDLRYGMRLMSAGRGKVTAQYSDASVTAMQYHVDALLALATVGSKLSTTLSVVKQQIQRLDKTYIASKDFSEDTISYRLKHQAAAIANAFFEMYKTRSPEDIGRWEVLKNNIIANRERLEPKMTAHIAALERNAITKAAEKERKALALHEASKAAEKAYLGYTPPFPTHDAQTPPKAPESPANGTANPLTAFLGSGATPLAQTPTNSLRTEPPTHQTLSAQDVPAWLSGAPETPKEPAPQPRQIPPMPELKPVGPEDVESWLANLPKEPIRPPRPAGQEPQAQLDGAHTSNALPENDAPIIPPIQKMHTLADIDLAAIQAQADAEYERQKAAGEI